MAVGGKAASGRPEPVVGSGSLAAAAKGVAAGRAPQLECGPAF